MQAYEILLAQLSTAENLMMTACSGARWRLTFGDKVYLLTWHSEQQAMTLQGAVALVGQRNQQKINTWVQQANGCGEKLCGGKLWIKQGVVFYGKYTPFRYIESNVSTWLNTFFYSARCCEQLFDNLTDGTDGTIAIAQPATHLIV